MLNSNGFFNPNLLVFYIQYTYNNDSPIYIIILVKIYWQYEVRMVHIENIVKKTGSVISVTV